MSADVVAEVKVHVPLGANVGRSVQLTGQFDNWVEIVHTDPAELPAFVFVAEDEDGLPPEVDWVPAADGWDVVLPGERLPVPSPKESFWCVLVSAGAPVVSVIGVRERWQ